MSDKSERIKEVFDTVEWNKIKDIDRALNWDLLWGPHGDDYWTEVEPLEHYKWEGFTKAVDDLNALLESVPHTIWWDNDSDGIALSDPQDDEEYWVEDTDGGEPLWIGGDSWAVVIVAQEVLHKATYEECIR